jgi:hypothetical protein
MLISVIEINDNKRFIAFFSGGKTTIFGQTNNKTGTYIDHQDELKKTNYIKRHTKDLITNDHKRAGYLSLFCYVLNQISLIAKYTSIKKIKIMIGVSSDF